MVRKLTEMFHPERLAQLTAPEEPRSNLMNKTLPFIKNRSTDESIDCNCIEKNKNGDQEENKYEQELEDGDIESMIKSNRVHKIIKLKEKIKSDHAPEKKIFFADIGGIEEIINEVKELIVYPIKFSHLFKTLGVKSPKGILLCGPPGSGKTSLGLAICNEMGRPYKKITGTEIISGMSGESESKLRAMFEEIREKAPSIIFIDEIDTIASKKDNAPKEMEKRIVSQLLSCLDDIADTDVFVIGATSRPESLDPGLRRSGRFDREITLSIPNEKARYQILLAKTKDTKLADVDLMALAKLIPGYVGADIEALVKEVGYKRLLF